MKSINLGHLLATSFLFIPCLTFASNVTVAWVEPKRKRFLFPVISHFPTQLKRFNGITVTFWVLKICLRLPWDPTGKIQVPVKSYLQSSLYIHTYPFPAKMPKEGQEQKRSRLSPGLAEHLPQEIGWNSIKQCYVWWPSSESFRVRLSRAESGYRMTYPQAASPCGKFCCWHPFCTLCTSTLHWFWHSW